MDNDVIDLKAKKSPNEGSLFAKCSFAYYVLLVVFIGYQVAVMPKAIRVEDSIPANDGPPLISTALLWTVLLLGPILTAISYSLKEKRSFFKVSSLVISVLIVATLVFAVSLALIVDGKLW